MRLGDHVAFNGDDDEELLLWHGHPGRIVDLGLYPTEIAVSFVNGPSLCLRPEHVERLDDESYQARGRRVLTLRHPTAPDRSIPQFWLKLEPWQDDDLLRRR